MASKTATRKRICIIGGGATGTSMLWALSSQARVREQIELTLIHDDAKLGGHSRTVDISVPGYEGSWPVDVGVQFVCRLLYPNLQRLVKLPEFEDSVFLDDHPELRISSTFTEQLNWGNFPAYQSGPLFSQAYTWQAVYEALRFTLAVDSALIEGRFNQTLSQYFSEFHYTDHFKNYFLLPYLSILNGYGGSQLLLDCTFEDLFPVFMMLHWPGPLGAFTHPGRGWQRFRDGSGTWIDAMANYALSNGPTTIHLSSRAKSVYPNADGSVRVIWTDCDGQHEADFDEVVMTTDMTVNRELLDNPNNHLYSQQQPHISEQRFPLKGGSCYIHVDEGVFPPYFKEREETVQFTAYYCQAPGQNPPYSIEDTYSTYVLKNMVPGIPPCYLSMYGVDTPERPPAADKTMFSIQWRHGHFLGSYFYDSARQIHPIQGLGHMWFAGNNTTQDSEEGALISAMVIAGKVCADWQYPFKGLNEATGMYLLFRDMIMFPTSPNITREQIWHKWVEIMAPRHMQASVERFGRPSPIERIANRVGDKIEGVVSRLLGD